MKGACLKSDMEPSENWRLAAWSFETEGPAGVQGHVRRKSEEREWTMGEDV